MVKLLKSTFIVLTLAGGLSYATDVTLTVIDSTNLEYQDIRFKGAFSSWALVQGYDDGTNGDAVASDHIWTAVIADVTAGDYEWGAIDTKNEDGTTCSTCDGSDGWGTWLPSLAGFTSNPKFTVGTDGTVSGDTTINFPAIRILTVTVDSDFTLTSGEEVSDVRFKGSISGWALFQGYDDGTNGDVTASDGIWSAIPPDTTGDFEWGAIDTDNGDGTSCSTCDGSDGWGAWLLGYMPKSDGGANRKITVHSDGRITGQTGFQLSVIKTVTTFIYFEVDMAAYERLGIYSKERQDSLQVRGGFNSWAGTVMNRIPGTTKHEATVEMTDEPGATDKYKYYLDLSKASFDLIEPNTPDLEPDDYGTGVTDGWYYENPPKFGGGDRPFTFTGDTTKTQELGLEYYNGIPPAGIIPEGDTVTVTFAVDMGPAFIEAVPFDATTDSVWFMWKDKWGEYLNSYYDHHADMLLNDGGTDGDATAGDSIYTVTFNVAGPSIMSFVYVYEYGDPATQEGGGFASGRYRIRYITPLNAAAGVWPTTYTVLDTFQKDPPMPVETLPEAALATTAGGTYLPDGFTLYQNHPNPFNPTTEIKFILPEAGEVTLSVYNLLGQQVISYRQTFGAPGTYGLRLDGTDMWGRPLPSGIYIYQLQTPTHRAVRKMTLLK